MKTPLLRNLSRVDGGLLVESSLPHPPDLYFLGNRERNRWRPEVESSAGSPSPPTPKESCSSDGGLCREFGKLTLTLTGL